MDLQKQYFFLTKHFTPDYSNDFLLIDNDIYKHIPTEKVYRKRLLYDFGWGQELGYVSYPEPSFVQLLSLIEYIPCTIKNNPLYFLSKRLCKLDQLCTNNSLGAISIIMQEYVGELIAFLENKVQTDYFEDLWMRRRFRRFVFDREKAKKFGILTSGSVNSKSYEDIFQSHAKWALISEKVIEQVYK